MGSDSDSTTPLGHSDTVPAEGTGGLLSGAGVDDPDLSGTLLADRYEVIEQLGAGGMGTVYLAEHLAIRKRVAIKVLKVDFCVRRESIERFLQEARTASQIRQENVVEITDFGFSDERVPFLTMELLDGEELADVITREGPQPWPRVRAILLQVLAALEAAHAEGIIHRDMKPQNCFLIRRGDNPDFVKVLDFGLAKVITGDSDYRSMTHTGAVMGTARYMSPEQARSERLDARADLYSVGVMAFELLTGRVPHDAPGFLGVLSKLLTEDVPSMASIAPEVGVHPKVEALVSRALAKDREQRFASAAEFAAAIRELPAELVAPPSRCVSLRAILAGVAGVVAVVVGLVLWHARALEQEQGDVAAATSVAVAAEPEPELPEPPASPEPDLQVEPPVEPPVEPEPDPSPAPQSELASAAGKPEPAADAPASTKSAQPEQAKAKPTSEPLPDTPSKVDMKSALRAAEQAALDCGEQHHPLMPTVKVSFDVGPSGGVSNATTLAPVKGTPAGRCVAHAIEALRFPKSRLGTSETVTLPLRPR